MKVDELEGLVGEGTPVGYCVKAGDWLRIDFKDENKARRFTYLARALGAKARYYKEGEAIPDYVKPASAAQRKLVFARVSIAKRERDAKASVA